MSIEIPLPAMLILTFLVVAGFVKALKVAEKHKKPLGPVVEPQQTPPALQKAPVEKSENTKASEEATWWPFSSPYVRGWREKNPKIAIFSAWLIFLYVAAIYLYPSMRAWLLTPYGVGLLLLFLAMISILVKLAETFKGAFKGSQLTVIMFALLTVALLDPGLMYQLPTEYKAHFKACPGIPPKTVEALGSNWEKFNPNGCDTQVAVTKGVVLLSGPGLSRPIRVAAGDYSIPKDANVIYTQARAEGGEALWYHMECDPGKRVVGKWECR